MLQQAHSHYDSHATVLALLLISELTIKKDIDSEVYLLTIETHHESISFLFVLLIITSLSAGVLHVPACKHDRPPLPGFTFYVHALCTTKLSLLAVLIATPEAIRTSVRVIYCNGHNEENQVSENQYFHAAQAYS